MPEFCPSRSSDLVWLQRNNESVTTYEHVNECSQRAIKRRNEALLNAKTPFSSLTPHDQLRILTSFAEAWNFPSLVTLALIQLT
jgi:hypothetical protein